MSKIAIIQGRLVDKVKGKIQAFPREHWEQELEIASKNKIQFIELTIDFDNIWENPISSTLGQEHLKKKLIETNIEPIACTADFIMQSPPWKGSKDNFNEMIFVTKEIIKGLGNINCPLIVIPFVDNSSVSGKSISLAITFLLSLTEVLKSNKIRVSIESDLKPKELKSFIEQLPSNLFGINYDIGNSASLGFNYKDEFEAYFDRIIHIHIKDRILNGATVPLGEGNADLQGCFKSINDYGYTGNFSMQTARDPQGKHVEAMLRYFKIINNLLYG
jgi:L-ribulose-5-phosphate 3-epimerase